jgi:phosphoribosylglycinamide formyltransferase-1
MPARRLRIGILASGSGTNFQALAEACRDQRIPAEVALLIVNVPGAGALVRAEKLGVPSKVIEHKRFADRAAFEKEVVAELKQAGVEVVCLAGFMRLVGQTLLDAFAGRMLNIHPALLPSFPGLNGIKQAFDYGVAITGCTVHFVDAGTDTGPILLQAAVPVLSDDTEQTLAERIHAEEHRLYPEAVKLIAEGRVAIEGRRVRISSPPTR